MADYAVILVHTTSHAVFAERVLAQAGLMVKLIPTPRHLSSDCGTAVRILAPDMAVAAEKLAASGVPLERIELWTA